MTDILIQLLTEKVFSFTKENSNEYNAMKATNRAFLAFGHFNSGEGSLENKASQDHENGH